MTNGKAHTIASLFVVIAATLGLARPAHSQSPPDLMTAFSECVIVLADLKTVSDAYAVNIVDTSHKVRAGKMTWAEGLKSVNTAIGQIKARWATYDDAKLNANERKSADATKAAMMVANAATSALITILRAKDQAALDEFVIEKVYPAIDPVTEGVSKLIDLRISECTEKRQ
jgi:methyl-accepting chemotaxis protein